MALVQPASLAGPYKYLAQQEQYTFDSLDYRYSQAADRNSMPILGHVQEIYCCQSTGNQMLFQQLRHPVWPVTFAVADDQ
jgi:hypothetical protein